jgi:hypothetical protein
MVRPHRGEKHRELIAQDMDAASLDFLLYLLDGLMQVPPHGAARTARGIPGP